jgi:phospholipid-binding lipoprotein MlaA
MKALLHGRLLTSAIALLAAGCAAVPAEKLGTVPPRHVLPPTQQYRQDPMRVYDPFEGFNRAVYKFNTQFDRYVFLPVVRTYEKVTPVFAQDRVSSFFANITEIENASNAVLQLRPEAAGRAVMRFAFNSTFGLLGLFDLASLMGLPRQSEDFGQTLGRWGIGLGPYLVLPILGPSSFRDAGGLAVDTAVMYVPPVDKLTQRVFADPAVYGLYAVDRRHQVSFRYYETGSPFEYDLVRFLYSKKRELDIRQ